MKDSVIAVFEVALLLSALAAAAPRGKSRSAAAPVQAQYASFISMAAPAAPAPAAVSAAKPAPVAPAPQQAEPAPAPAAAPAPAPASAPASVASAPRQPLDIGPSNQLWGVVDSVDASGRLSVKDRKGRVHVLPVTPDLPVTIGGENKPASLRDLKPGDNVTVTAADSAISAVHVRLLFPPLAKAP